MIMLVLDTDHLGEFQIGMSAAARTLRERLVAASDPVGATIISVEEMMRGWLAAIHRKTDPSQQIGPYTRLQHLFQFFASWTVLPWNAAAVSVFNELRDQGIRVGTMDVKIASIVLANNAKLLSRNLRDFHKIPGLKVEDWLS